MARLTIQGRLVVAGIGLLFVVLFGLLMPWWLFVLFVVVMLPMFYKLLAT
ncbi:hypothetical protein HWV23_04555 [Natronomonas halophila]|nr:hypothetical protein [Natronomonas halophila]QLD85020.1 hypothetical protein HWV23_04555 [Natronomonas halophila]